MSTPLGRARFINADASIRGTDIAQRVTELGLEAAGQYALAHHPTAAQGNTAPLGPDHVVMAMSTCLWKRAMSIYGGSNETQRKFVAKRSLGM